MNKNIIIQRMIDKITRLWNIYLKDILNIFFYLLVSKYAYLCSYFRAEFNWRKQDYNANIFLFLNDFIILIKYKQNKHVLK
jgi:hypothetical protein